MTKLANSSAFISLLLRSPDIGDGWRKVSNMLREIVIQEVNKAPELFELEDGVEGLRVRFSERGLVAADYI